MTALVATRADRFGRRRTLIVLAVLAAAGLVAVAYVTGPTALMLTAFAGMVNGMGRDRGPAGAIEQAILPETTDASSRTWVLAVYNVVIDVGHAAGAAAAALPSLLIAAGWTRALRASRDVRRRCRGCRARGRRLRGLLEPDRDRERALRLPPLPIADARAADFAARGAVRASTAWAAVFSAPRCSRTGSSIATACPRPRSRRCSSARELSERALAPRGRVARRGASGC